MQHICVVIHQYRIRIDLLNNVVEPRNQSKFMVLRSTAMFPGNMTLHLRNWATLFIFAHHVTHVGSVTIT